MCVSVMRNKRYLGRKVKERRKKGRDNIYLGSREGERRRGGREGKTAAVSKINSTKPNLAEDS